MKNRLIFLSGIFVLTIISTDLFSQSLTLVGDAKLSLKGDGVIVSVPSVKLKDFSQLIQAEGLKLTDSDYIQILSPDALLKTRSLVTGEKVSLSVGIDSKTNVIIVNRSSSTAYSIGIDKLNEPEALPFFWKVSSLSEDGQEGNADLQFSWDEEVEPEDFKLKSLVQKEGSEWVLDYNQEIQDTTVFSKNYAELTPDGMAFTISNNRFDADGDGVPEIQEIREETDPNDPTDYLDIDGDKVPDYLEEIQDSNPLDPTSYMDSNNDGVADYVRDRSPIMFINSIDIKIPWGFTDFESILSDSVTLMLGSGKIIKSSVQWDTSNLDVFSNGVYQVLGSYELYPGLFDAYELMAYTLVEVLRKPAPQDVLLSTDGFDPDPDKYFQEIGNFTVIDPVDNVHFITLVPGAEDNKYFEVKSGILFWSSADEVSGKTEFKVVVQVTDRDGNVIEKLFTVNRGRTDIMELEIFNSFTPNDDGINDTWGVPDLRYYTGVRVQVFDRNSERMFYTEDADVRWDGTYKGKEMPVGTYFWVVEVIETGLVRRGILTILKD